MMNYNELKEFSGVLLARGIVVLFDEEGDKTVFEQSQATELADAVWDVEQCSITIYEGTNWSGDMRLVMDNCLRKGGAYVEIVDHTANDEMKCLAEQAEKYYPA